jgi:hypothetical protein
MLKLFTNTNKALEKTAREFEAAKKDFDKAFYAAKNQRDELLATKLRLEEANSELLRLNAALSDSSKLLADMAHAAGELICRKDSEGRFLFVNEYQCTNFFGMHKSCLSYAIGKTDIDLINEYREKTGNIHTFGDICVATDEHCKQQGKRELYLEFGEIADKKIILKMIKTPILDLYGKDDGVVCFGWDISVLCNGIADELTKGMLEHTVEKLDNNVYWIKDSHTCQLPSLF